MKRFARIHSLVKRAERTLAARPPFADPMDANKAMLAFQASGQLPADPRQAAYIREWSNMIQAMAASVPQTATGGGA